MKKSLLLLLSLSWLTNLLLANGVVFTKSQNSGYFKLIESNVGVRIESQVSSTTALQTFVNNVSDSIEAKYAFPVPVGASATMLRYSINGKWYMTSFAASPQDTSTSDSVGQQDFKLKKYLGSNPLYFDVLQTLYLGDTIFFELTYVELLKYQLGNVTYNYPNNYSSIQPTNLNKQEITISLKSARKIENIELISHSAQISNNNGTAAFVSFSAFQMPADSNYLLSYSLSLDELGLFSLSTTLPDSLKKDTLGRGFFAFIVEPEPSSSNEVINKVFTLIIDRSGSMSGNKMYQAQESAKFIVNNMNNGDKFNIVSFATDVSSFRNSHVAYNVSNKTEANNYINALVASGSINISGAFDKAVPHFSSADTNTANIIIFITDGQPTAGITGTDSLAKYINNLITKSEKGINVFSFGIGNPSPNLLTSIATNSGGIYETLGENEVEAVLKDFHLMVKNPVLLNTNINFSADIVGEVYPVKLPNLYLGQQMILLGRYNKPQTITSTLKGKSYNKPVKYSYEVSLADSFNNDLLFLTKLWAQSKIEHLMNEFYLSKGDSAIKAEIIELSLAYGVISPFTSFRGDSGGSRTGIEFDFDIIENNSINQTSNEYLVVESLYPNPCFSDLNISLRSTEIANGRLSIKIINTLGKEVYQNTKLITPSDFYLIQIDAQNIETTNGLHYVILEFEGKTIQLKVIIN